jgi:hypothetical protein
METAFTPTPWRVVDGYRVEAEGFGLIAAVRGADGDPEVRANAYVISAAPDLYGQTKLLERCIEHQIAVAKGKGDDEGARLQTLTLHVCREALAKAEGREPPTAEATIASVWGA